MDVGGMVSRGLGLVAWLAVWSLAGAAHAEAALPKGAVVAILPGGELSDHRLEAGVRASLLAALDKLGYATLAPAQVRRRLADADQLELCQDLSGCDYKLLMASVDAQAVVVYSLWLEDDVPSEFAVAVTHAERRGDASYDLQPDESLAVVVPKVLYRALSRIEREVQVRVKVVTDPPGASIEVDRRLTGTSPAVFELPPGQHEVRASAEGRVAVLDYVEVEEGEGEQEVSLSLPEAEVLAVPEYNDLASAEPDHTFDYVLGGVLGAAAVAGVAYGVLTFGDEGDCFTEGDVDTPSGRRCEVVVSPPTLTLAALAGAGVLATGSILLFALTPFSSASGDVAGLQLSGQF